ncbi:MAG: guanylate kinase [Alphaproteobacteria bacterium]|nr:guanylate kinase [Alphaproteobacteria bacterium]
MQSVKRLGLFFVFSAPSGTGKTSLSRALLEKDSELRPSISATTRMPREGEVHGKDYHFLDEKTFLKSIDHQEFVEHTKIFNHHYGTLKAPLEHNSSDSKDSLLALDWAGAKTLRELYGKQAILIYVLPPQLADLEKRLIHRGKDSPQRIKERLSCAYNEIQACVHYDYVITNDEFDRATAQAWSIIQSERCRVHHHSSVFLLQPFSSSQRG